MNGHKEQNDKADRSAGFPSLNGKEPSVRDRVRGRMRELLVAGTAAGIGLSATLCSVSCDPLPPPYWSCTDAPEKLWRNGLLPQAQWRKIGRDWSVRVTIQIDRWNIASSLTFNGNPVLTGARLDSVKIDTLASTFTCIPDSGVAKVSVQQPLSCDSRTFAVNFDLDVSAGPVDSAAVPVAPK